MTPHNIHTDDDRRVDLEGPLHRLAAAIEPLFLNLPLAEKADRVARAALASAPGVDAYAVCLVEGPAVRTRAHAGEQVEELHTLQHTMHEGTCWATTCGERDHLAYENLEPDRSDGPPPDYRTAAARLGIRSQASVRICVRRRTAGALTVFSRSQGRAPLGVDSLAVVGHLLGLAVDQATLREGLEQGLRNRTTIGAALGIVMERYGLTEQVALDHLKRRSSAENRKLRDLAADIVAATPRE